MPKAHVNGIDINYRFDGSETAAETIVLVCGLGDDINSWDFQMPALLDAGFRVLRFDNRGIGGSDRPAGPYSSKLLCEDTKALVDFLGLNKFHLLGFSMGGMTVQEYALAYPGDLKSAIFGSTYAKADTYCQMRFSLWGDIAAAVGVPAAMRDAALCLFTIPFFEDRPDDLAAFTAGMAQLDMSSEDFLAQLAAVQTHDAASRLDQIAVPSLVMAAVDDILIPLPLSKRLHGAIAGAKWATVPGGHACLWENPEPFNKVIVDFFKSNAG
ncbi:MAG: alpha/beta hydrolase [Pseudomonadota bacterium]